MSELQVRKWVRQELLINRATEAQRLRKVFAGAVAERKKLSDRIRLLHTKFEALKESYGKLRTAFNKLDKPGLRSAEGEAVQEDHTPPEVGPLRVAAEGQRSEEHGGQHLEQEATPMEVGLQVHQQGQER